MNFQNVSNRAMVGWGARRCFVHWRPIVDFFQSTQLAGHQLERLRLITSLHSDHQIWCGWETVTILWWLNNLFCPIMVLFKHSMANRQMRFDMCDNYPNALGKCFTMLSLAGRPTRLSSIFQRPENRAIYYVVSWDISIFFHCPINSLTRQWLN